MSSRTERVNVLLRDEISHLMAHQVKDPRLPRLVSITQVQTSVDLQHARVYVSVMGSREEKDQALTALESASGFMRKELRSRLDLKHIPELHFVLDETIEQADRVLRLMNSLHEPKPQEGH